MNHVITIKDILITLGVIVALVGAGIGLLWAVAKGMSDTQ